MPSHFTPEQISQILEEFFKVVGTRQYIGARYVPIFGRKDEESIEWDNTAPYEPLTIVLYQGNSYTSRQFVPVGVEITNQEFWALTGNYNAQVEQYRRETAAAREVADTAQNDIDTLLPKADFSAENTVKQYIDHTENTIKQYVDRNKTRVLSFDTVADMQSASYLDAGMICHTNGFHAEGDGGAAYYSIDASGTANGMDVLACANELFATLVITGSYVTPEMFGAYGDNTHDDTNNFVRMFLLANKVVLRKNVHYLISSSLTVPFNCSIEGYGGEVSELHYTGAGFCLVCEAATLRWYTSPITIKNIGIISDMGGTIKFSNVTQGVIESCRLRCTIDADIDNVLMSNESHCSVIRNNYILGGNGIVIDDTCNECLVENNYVTYCNKAISIYGNACIVRTNDVEGFSTTPYVIHSSNGIIDCYGERNKISASTNSPWISLSGNNNKIDCRMYSDGGDYYLPLMAVEGNSNDITFRRNTGFSLILNPVDGIANKFHFVSALTLRNDVLVSFENVIGNELSANSGQLLIDSDVTPIDQIFSGDFTYDPSNKNVVFSGSEFYVDLSSYYETYDVLYAVYRYEGLSFASHGRLVTQYRGDQAPVFNCSNNIICMPKNSNYYRLYSDTAAANRRIRIDAFKVSNVLCKELFEYDA